VASTIRRKNRSVLFFSQKSAFYPNLIFSLSLLGIWGRGAERCSIEKRSTQKRLSDNSTKISNVHFSDRLNKFFFLVGFWSWSADKLSFHPYEAGFYKPTVLKVHPPFCRITAYATNG